MADQHVGAEDSTVRIGPPPFLAPGTAERQHPTGAVIHQSLTYSVPDGYRPLQMDVYVPVGLDAPAACVVWIHGGAWLFGSRQTPPDYWPEGALFQTAIDAGLAVASIDYRHSREASFPAQLHDAKAAVRYLRRFAGRARHRREPDRGVGRIRRRTPRRTARPRGRPRTRGHGRRARREQRRRRGRRLLRRLGRRHASVVPRHPAPRSGSRTSSPKARHPKPIPTSVILARTPLDPANARRLLSPVHHARAGGPPFLLVHGDARPRRSALAERSAPRGARGCGGARRTGDRRRRRSRLRGRRPASSDQTGRRVPPRPTRRPERHAMTLPTFPADFLWGVATAGHQNEGDNVTSDTWFLENVTPTIFKDRSGQGRRTAGSCGSPTSTSSPAWASTPTASRSSGRASSRSRASSRRRRSPTTRRSIDGCLARGLAPIVTFNHFTSPHWFAGRGAWLDAEAPALFARYCGVVMDRFGDRIELAVTFNEPDLPEMLTWAGLPGLHSPSSSARRSRPRRPPPAWNGTARAT